MKQGLVFLFCFLLQKLSVAQFDTLKLPLKKNLGLGPFDASYRVTYLDDSAKVRGIPKEIKNFIIKYVTFEYDVPTNSGIDDVYQSTLYLLVGIKSDSIAIAVDCNGNFDFSDEKLLMLPSVPTVDYSLPTIDIPIRLNKRQFNYTIQPYPYPTHFKYSSEREQKYYLMIKRYEYKTTETFDNNNNSIYVVYSKVNPCVTDSKTVNFAIKREDGRFKHYSMEEYFSIGNVRYLFQSVNAALDTLVLVKADTSIARDGYVAGLYLKPFLVKDLGNKSFFLPIKTKYTLIDFWGTWCAPCKKLTPQLKAIHSKFRTSVEVVSVAVDDDIQGVRNYILKNRMLWNHVQESFKENLHPIADKFNVKSYPTFVLIDPSGKIIVRGEGKEILDKIQTILQ